MKPIEQFPYGDEGIDGRLLLLRLNKAAGPRFAVGYYNVMHDLFRVCASLFLSGSMLHYGDYPTGGDPFCVSMQDNFTFGMGPRCIDRFMSMEAALRFMMENGLCMTDIKKKFTDADYGIQYLVCTHDRHIVVAETVRSADGWHLAAAISSSYMGMGGRETCKRGPVPVSSIEYAVNLETFMGLVSKMKQREIVIDVDELYGAMERLDMEYMQQADIVGSIQELFRKLAKRKDGNGNTVDAEVLFNEIRQVDLSYTSQADVLAYVRNIMDIQVARERKNM